MAKDAKTIREELARPFAPEDLEWRIQVTSKDKTSGLAIPYVTNRAIQDRLDEVVGPENWYNDYKPWHGNGKKDAQICGISIYFEGKGFITKWDGAEDSDIEPIKGGLSDSMKRSAVQWGIGRVLYKMTKPLWVKIEQKGNSYVICDKLPLQPSSPNTTNREPYGLEKRHAAYSEMLSLLTLSDRHRDNLHERGLPDEVIERNGYKSMPETESERRLLASLLRCDHELHGLPSFYTKDGTWTLAGANGFLIPVRNKDGLIQGMKIRLDDDAARKYRWLSSRPSRMENGARSYSWIHVTGDTTQKRAYLTEGPLKGDIASYFANNALFVCLGGVNAHKGLRETLQSLGVTEVMEAMDMDQFTNPQVRQAIGTLRREVQSIPGIRYYQCTWNPRFKGVDDYLLNWTKRKTA